MSARVPVLGEHDVLKAGRDAMDGGDDGIAIGDGERAAGAEIVLNIDDDEQIVSGDLHESPISIMPVCAERKQNAGATEERAGPGIE